MNRKKKKNLRKENKTLRKNRKQSIKVTKHRKKEHGAFLAFLFSIADFISGRVRNGFLGFIFADLYTKVNNKWKNSFIYGAFRRGNKKVHTHSPILKLYEQGRTNQYLSVISQRIIHYKLKVLGAGVFFFALAMGIASISKLYAQTTSLDYEVKNFIIAGVILCISIPMILSKHEFGETLLAHKFTRFVVTDVLNLNANAFERSDAASEGRYLITFFLSVCVGLLTFFVDVKALIGILILLIIVSLIMSFPEIGVLMLIVFIPFASLLNHPTIFVLFLISFCMIGFIFKFIRGKRVLKFEIFDILILAMGLLLFFGGIFSQSADSWKSADTYIAFLCMYFLIVNMYIRKSGIYRGFKATVIVGYLVSLIGSVEGILSRGNLNISSVVDLEQFDFITVRVSSLLGNPNTLGVYLLLVFPIAIAQMMVTHKKKLKLFYFITVCSILVCSVMTWSRGTWLGLIAATVVFMLMYNFRTVWVLIFGGAAAPLAILLYQKLITFVDFSNPVVERFISIFNFNSPDTSIQSRGAIWSHVWDMISDNWLTGIGVGESAFRTVFFNYTTPDLLWPAHTHNLYLQIFLELGIVGIVIFAVILFAYLQKCFANIKVRNQKSKARTMICAGYASIFGVCVMGLTDHVWYNHRVFLMSWIIIALTIALTKVNETERELEQITNNMRCVDIEVG